MSLFAYFETYLHVESSKAWLRHHAPRGGWVKRWWGVKVGEKNLTKMGAVGDHSWCGGVYLHWTHQRYPALSELSIWCCLNTGTLSWLLICGISFPFVHGTSFSFGWKQERDYWQVRTRLREQGKGFGNSTSIGRKSAHGSSDHLFCAQLPKNPSHKPFPFAHKTRGTPERQHGKVCSLSARLVLSSLRLSIATSSKTQRCGASLL